LLGMKIGTSDSSIHLSQAANINAFWNTFSFFFKKILKPHY
jgi:hypothetical protein